jgi:predicted acyl esterase
MALVHPHPALKVAVPMNPMVDGWMGDDWFHNGAFRQQNMSYIYGMVPIRARATSAGGGYHDDYDLYLRAGSAGDMARAYGMEHSASGRSCSPIPPTTASGGSGGRQAAGREGTLKVPTMLVHSLWDQEDIYGDMAVYRALAAARSRAQEGVAGDGPMAPCQDLGEGNTIGALDLGSDTGTTFRQDILRPFLAQYLKDDAPKADIAPVNAFVTGDNTWRKLDTWPSACRSGCAPTMQRWYLEADGGLGVQRRRKARTIMSPIPPSRCPTAHARSRRGPTAHPTRWTAGPSGWWTTSASSPRAPTCSLMCPPYWTSRWTSRRAAGSPARLHQRHGQRLGGQADRRVSGRSGGEAVDGRLPAADRHGDFPRPLSRGLRQTRRPTPDKPLDYRFPLPTVNHVFLPGHRVMVQVQSSWFPLYDRNPQTFVPNIFNAKPGDYRKATQTILRDGSNGTFVELPVVR